MSAPRFVVERHGNVWHVLDRRRLTVDVIVFPLDQHGTVAHSRAVVTLEAVKRSAVDILAAVAGVGERRLARAGYRVPRRPVRARA